MEASVLDPNSWKVWGPLGVYALVATIAVVKLYRDQQAQQKAHEREMKTLLERYITKAETWMAKYEQFAQVVTRVLDALSRRTRRDSGGRNGGSEG